MKSQVNEKKNKKLSNKSRLPESLKKLIIDGTLSN